jgi:hypothetical protein
MQKLNRPLKVYLCKSNLTLETQLRSVRQSLIDQGFEVAEHEMGKTYDPTKLSHQDFVLMVPPLDKTMKNDIATWVTTVGRGQYDEVLRAIDAGMPVFIYMGQTVDGRPLMSKVEEFRGHHTRTGGTSWKADFGNICSFVFGTSPVCLTEFVTVHFLMRDKDPIRHGSRLEEHPLTPEECYKGKKRLLLLLNT